MLSLLVGRADEDAGLAELLEQRERLSGVREQPSERTGAGNGDGEGGEGGEGEGDDHSTPSTSTTKASWSSSSCRAQSAPSKQKNGGTAARMRRWATTPASTLSSRRASSTLLPSDVDVAMVDVVVVGDGGERREREEDTTPRAA